MIKIVQEKIDTAEVLASVQSESCGANVLFVGTTRNLTDGQETKRLSYDCYSEMATKEIQKLCDQAFSKWPIERVSAVHRTGMVEVGEASIAIAVSSPHRQAAFAAAQWLIDTLKKQVPIWKQEHWADGTTEWIHPDGATPRMEAPGQ